MGANVWVEQPATIYWDSVAFHVLSKCYGQEKLFLDTYYIGCIVQICAFCAAFVWDGPSKNVTAQHLFFFYFLPPLGADVINFDGHVVLPYRFGHKKKTLKTLKDVIALKFKTSESEGVIFHGEGQQGDYITLELKKAQLVLSLNLGMCLLLICLHNGGYNSDCYPFPYFFLFFSCLWKCLLGFLKR